MTDEKQSLVRAPAGTQLMRPAAAELNPLQQDAPVIWSSIEDPMAVIAMLNEETKLSDHIGETILVRDVVGHVVRMTDEKTGEVKDQARTVVITPEGVGYSCVSSGVNTSIKILVSLLGAPPWTEPLRLMVREQRTRAGFRVMKLVPVIERDEPAKAAKKK